MAKLRITYTKSAIGYSQDQKDTVRSLGLRKLNSTAVHNDTPAIRGMAFKVRHLVRMEEVAEEHPTKAPAAKPARAKPAPAAGAEQAAKPARAPKAAASAGSADDLTVIEGIGPKIAGTLNAEGITTFAQLAATDANRLSEILQGAGLRLANAETWPEQAELAAAGKWEELQALTAQLKGGRRK